MAMDRDTGGDDGGVCSGEGSRSTTIRWEMDVEAETKLSRDEAEAESEQKRRRNSSGDEAEATRKTKISKDCELWL